MFGSFSNSWRLVKASFSVLRADKELMVFPIVSTVASFIVMISFAIPMAVVGSFNRAADGNLGILEYGVAFLFYMTMSFVVIFANSALIGAAMIRLRGGDPTLADGFRIAREHLPHILGYAAISATVGVILRLLQERGGTLGDILAWIGNLAWGVATYLVVPVLVVEGLGPIDAIQRSANLLKRTWGEQIVGNMSMGFIFFLITIAALFVVGVPLVMLAIATSSILVVVLAIGVAILMIAAISLVSSALNGIYVAAVYAYTTEGVVNEQFFQREIVEGAFRHK